MTTSTTEGEERKIIPLVTRPISASEAFGMIVSDGRSFRRFVTHLFSFLSLLNCCLWRKCPSVPVRRSHSA